MKIKALTISLATLMILGMAQTGAAAPDKNKAKPKTSGSEAPAQLVWPAPPAPAKIKWVTEYRSEFDVGAKKRHAFMDRLAGKGEDALAFKRPRSVAVDDDGLLFVGDFGLGVVGIDLSLHRMWLFSEVSKRGFATPTGVAVDSKMVYPALARHQPVGLVGVQQFRQQDLFAEFDKEGHYINGLGAQDGINRPVGVAVDEAKNIVVVVNGGAHEVRLYNRQLKLIKKIGGRGEQMGQFNFPTYACMVPGTGFVVTDTGNFRVQIFDYDGRFLRSIGRLGDSTGSFSRPKGLAVDPDNNLYVTDASFWNFQIFRLDGQLLTFVGTGGADRGQFQVPAGIAISKSGTIYVADEMNARVQVFQYLGKEGGAEKENK